MSTLSAGMSGIGVQMTEAQVSTSDTSTDAAACRRTQALNRRSAARRKARKVAMDKASELEMRAARCQSMGLSLLQDATKAMVEAALIRFTYREKDA